MPTAPEGSAQRAQTSRLASAGEQSCSAARRLRHLGWQVGLTYQAATPGGVDRDHLLRLLDEMAAHGMNTLSLMMQSYGYFDPGHDGYAWPPQHPKLQPYRDPAAINAQPGTEFLRGIIDAAAMRGIEIHLFLNWGIWNPAKIVAHYPDATLQHAHNAAPDGWLHCPDSPGAWQLGLDEVSDLLTFHLHPNVTSYAFERISYQCEGRCYCPHTQQAFLTATGVAMTAASPPHVEVWKQERIGGHLRKYTAHIRQVRPEITIGLHTQCAPGWGHDPSRLKPDGIDYLLPHTIQFPTTQRELYAMLGQLAPNPCVLHFCTRDRRPANYDLWIKTPAIIDEALQWVRDYPGDNLAGILFFNEPATSPANKQAVYRGLRRFTCSET